MTDRLRTQYEAYPYPARDPRDEARRLVTGSPSHRDELNHYVFGGRLSFTRPLRVLVAGGGTGDGTIMLAQQLRDAGMTAADIVYLDLSDAARTIAEARAAARGLTGIRFLQGSLFDLSGLGQFDYIDCCGVLHHLDDPAAGLASLRRALKPGGGMGIMVYAPHGRTGVYPLQDALRTLTGGLPDPERIDLARSLLDQLPDTNGFKRNPVLGDHLASDAGLYDLLLHSRDRAYTVPQLAELVAGAGLAITGLIEPLRYDPRTYLSDDRLTGRLDGLDRLAQAALAEQLAGNIAKHIVYLVRPEDAATAVARPTRPDVVVPVLKDLNGPAMARGLRPGVNLKASLDGLSLSLPLPRLAGPLLGRIDGRATLKRIFQDIVRDTGEKREVVESQFGQLYAVLNGLNKLLLRRRPV